MTQDFYDRLAPYYHLIYPSWNASVERQGRGLATVLNEFGVHPGARVLDAACGIGTQTLGLAALGYRLSASDLAPAAVARAQREAEARQLSVDFRVADLRHLSSVFPEQFSAVLVCDNVLPHLLTDAEIRQALEECRRCLVAGSVLLASVRDYAAIERKTPDVRSYGMRTEGDRRYAAEQIWEWDGEQYDVTLRLVEELSDGAKEVHEFHSRYYAVAHTPTQSAARRPT